MIFRRTWHGESNKHLFLRVDAIVYVEGGEPLCIEEVRAGGYHICSVDVQFWQQVFAIVFHGVRLDFRAVGGKATLLSLAEDVIAGRIRNVISAMDRDHDEFNGALRVGRNVICTRGYSWESDVWSPDVTEEVFFAICPVSRAAVEVRHEVDDLFAELQRKLRRLVYVDIVLAMQGEALLPRNRPDAVVEIESSGRPKVRVDELRKLLRQRREIRAGVVKASAKVSFDVLCNCVGHIVSTFCYRVVCYLLRQFSQGPRIARQHVEALAIEKLGQLCREGRLEAASDYYRRALATVQA